jgi:hypothetical protein
MAFYDPQDIQGPIGMERQLGNFASQFLRRPPDFSGADKMFSSMMTNPSIMRGGSGTILDPRQMQNTFSSNWMGERGDIASQNLLDKDAIARLLMGIGSNIGDLSARQTGLEAMGLGGSSMFSDLLTGQGL